MYVGTIITDTITSEINSMKTTFYCCHVSLCHWQLSSKPRLPMLR